jgi:membrane fusion protein (multidrug efflux system)
MKRPLLTASLILSAAVSLAACAEKKAAPPAPKASPVGYVVVQTQALNLTQELAGRTSAFLDADVRPQVGGIIKARQFTEGGLVSAGQSLYQIDPAPFQAAYDSALANQQQAQAALDLAKTNFGRDQQLITIRAISQADFDKDDAAQKQAAATLAQQKAAVETAQINLNYTRVTAPISGRIGKSSVTPGALVGAEQATALASIQDISKIYVDITQSSSDLLRLKQQMMSGAVGKAPTAAVRLTLDDGTAYTEQGTLQFSDVTVNPSTGSVTLRAIFPNPDGLLLPGMFVRAQIVKGQVDQAILIPQIGVIIDPKGNATVLLAGDDGKAHSQKVTLGQMTGSLWQIQSGLKPGDKVIVQGAMRLKPGGAIKASEIPTSQGTAAAAPTTGQ